MEQDPLTLRRTPVLWWGRDHSHRSNSEKILQGDFRRDDLGSTGRSSRAAASVCRRCASEKFGRSQPVPETTVLMALPLSEGRRNFNKQEE